jgi:DNA-binding transcriptional LysR family regulator
VELRQLRYFIEIAEQGSFTRAAETLSIAQPALSAQIHKLEAELNAPLFIRNKRGVVLTDVGRVVLENARKTVAAADATVRAAALETDAADSRIVLGYSSTFPVAQTARITRSLRRERPNARFDLREMRSADQVAALLSGEIDFALLQERPDLPEHGLVRVPVAVEFLTIALPSGHPLAKRRTVRLEELALESFIIPSANFGETARDEAYEACRRAGFTPRITQEAKDARILLGFVSAGLGVSIVSSAGRYVKIRGVSYVSITPEIAMHFAVMYRRGFGGKALAPFFARLHDHALT